MTTMTKLKMKTMNHLIPKKPKKYYFMFLYFFVFKFFFLFKQRLKDLEEDEKRKLLNALDPMTHLCAAIPLVNVNNMVFQI